VGFELKTLAVIGTDYIGSCKSNYHTITTTTVPSTQHSKIGNANKAISVPRGITLIVALSVPRGNTLIVALSVRGITLIVALSVRGITLIVALSVRGITLIVALSVRGITLIVALSVPRGTTLIVALAGCVKRFEYTSRRKD
jgi:hypothetical protein